MSLLGNKSRPTQTFTLKALMAIYDEAPWGKHFDFQASYQQKSAFQVIEDEQKTPKMWTQSRRQTRAEDSVTKLIIRRVPRRNVPSQIVYGCNV